jgi:hypothetical protein
MVPVESVSLLSSVKFPHDFLCLGLNESLMVEVLLPEVKMFTDSLCECVCENFLDLLTALALLPLFRFIKVVLRLNYLILHGFDFFFLLMNDLTLILNQLLSFVFNPFGKRLPQILQIAFKDSLLD